MHSNKEKIKNTAMHNDNTTNYHKTCRKQIAQKLSTVSMINLYKKKALIPASV